MVHLTPEEIRQKMAEILREQMERPALRPTSRSGVSPNQKMEADLPESQDLECDECIVFG